MVFYCCGVEIVNLVNLVLCLLILAVGCFDYARTKIRGPFNIGVAFGLFAVSHAISFFGMQRSLALTVILIRIFAYLIVLLSLWEMRSKSK